MQALFYLDVGDSSSDELLDMFIKNFEPEDNIRSFYLELVEGTLKHSGEINSFIEKHSNNWRLSRMSGVDRNVMRVAVFELISCSEIPSKVSINEAIDIGKKFGTDESGAFINGILDSIRIAIEDNRIPVRADTQIPVD